MANRCMDSLAVERTEGGWEMNGDLISRSAAKEELLSWAVCINKPHLLSKEDALHVLDTIPAVDACEVVRCRDCVYWQKAKMNRKGFLICPASGMEIMAKDFCSYGERRADE